MSSMLEGDGDCIGFHRLHSVGPFTGITASSTSLEDPETYRALHFLRHLPDGVQHVLESV